MTVGTLEVSSENTDRFRNNKKFPPSVQVLPRGPEEPLTVHHGVSAGRTATGEEPFGSRLGYDRTCGSA